MTALDERTPKGGEKFPKCVGCQRRRVARGTSFCTLRCAAEWAESMREGERWCYEHGAWSDDPDCVTASEDSHRFEPRQALRSGVTGLRDDVRAAQCGKVTG